MFNKSAKTNFKIFWACMCNSFDERSQENTSNAEQSDQSFVQHKIHKEFFYMVINFGITYNLFFSTLYRSNVWTNHVKNLNQDIKK